MATNYPASIDNSTSLPYPGGTNFQSSPDHAGLHDNVNDAIIATQTKLGVGASAQSPIANSVLLGTGSDDSQWGSITSAYTSGNTGTGNFVLASSPTISSPTISSPSISNPSFTGSLGNISTGTITSSGLITANGGLTVSSSFTATGLVTNADLLSTIFSGQVQSQANSGTASGTLYYVNLGGIKLLWATFTGIIGSPNPNNYTINFPSGFFNSIQMTSLTIVQINSTWNQSILGNSQPTTTSWQFGVYAVSTTVSEEVSFFAIGI